MTLTARIAAIRPSLEATPFAIVTLELANAGDRACVVTGYRIAWPSGVFEQRTAAIALAPYETKTYVVRMSASAGDVGDLLRNPATARVDILDSKVG